MTLEEKIAQLYCHGRVPEMKEQLLDEQGRPDWNKIKEHFPYGMGQIGRPSCDLAPRQSAELTNAIQRHLYENTRLGIPALFNEEGLHGLMGIGATSFPQAIALASTWDEDLVERVYTAIALETFSRGSNYIYTPVLDLARDPRWGRVEETFGEDPYLVSRLGVAAIHGLQGKSRALGYGRVMATAKHFAVHGQPEGGQNAAPGNVSERIIRQEFLPPFKTAVQEAGVMAVMASYNEVDGIPVHTHRWLLETVLRKEWGFDGLVTSDGMGVGQLVMLHGVAADEAEAAKQAIEAGVDVEVPVGLCYPSLLEQVQEGRVSLATIDRAVANLLRAKFALGLMDHLPPFVDPDQAVEINNCAEHRALALEAASKAIVLLKNDGDLLPFDPQKINKLAVIGPNAATLNLGGYSQDPRRGFSLLQGLQHEYGQQIDIAYAEGCRLTKGFQDWRLWHQDSVELSDPDEDEQRIADAVALAQRSDAVVLAIGGNEGTCREGWWFDHLGDRDSLALLGRQEELVEAVLAAGKPTVAVLINGRPLTIERIANKLTAILECWYLGQEGGIAIAQALFGAVNPGGKLTITFPRSVGQLPVYYYHKPSAKRGYLFAESAPLYPFGHGLSYTSFEYSDLKITPSHITASQTTRVKVSLKNCGRSAGDEVVQLYIRDRISTITRPVKELRGFKRVHLKSGETRRVSFNLTPQMLAALDEHMQPYLEPGIFDVMVGGSSVEHLTTQLAVRED
jgi:beta-glucosidase